MGVGQRKLLELLAMARGLGEGGIGPRMRALLSKLKLPQAPIAETLTQDLIKDKLWKLALHQRCVAASLAVQTMPLFAAPKARGDA